MASGLGIGAPSIYDPVSATWTDVPGPDPGAAATATLLPNGSVVVAGGGYGISQNTVQIFVSTNTTSITNTSSMAVARASHTATLLPNGLVLVPSSPNSELYNPATGTWSNTASLNTGRTSHTATMLPNGKLLVAGGVDSGLNGLASAELYDFSSRTWTNTGSMTTSRQTHTATLLLNGRVLVAGGAISGFGQPVATAELYEPLTGVWTPTGSMTINRMGHTATLLPNGKVLVAGGATANGISFTAVAAADLFDPATGTWTAVNPMSTNRAFHKAVLLPDGTVLVAGGVPGSISPAYNSAEIFDPATGLWQPTSSMNVGREYATMTLLPNDRVLVTGGYNFGYLTNAEMYDPATRLWTVTPVLSAARYGHTATLLPDGRVLLAGGNLGSNFTNLAELYTTQPGVTNSWRSAISSISSTLSPGGSLVLAGTHFRGISGGSGGSAGQDSPTDYPLVQLRSLDSGLTTYLLSASWTSNAFTSLPVNNFPPGLAMATIFANAIPGTGAVCLVQTTVPPAPILSGISVQPNGVFRFSFTNLPGAPFTVLTTSNLALQLSNWTAIGGLSEISPGQFQFTDPQPASASQRFYRVRSP
jgi:N-acetylneuraminic acid mutarotase